MSDSTDQSTDPAAARFLPCDQHTPTRWYIIHREPTEGELVKGARRAPGEPPPPLGFDRVKAMSAAHARQLAEAAGFTVHDVEIMSPARRRPPERGTPFLRITCAILMAMFVSGCVTMCIETDGFRGY